MNDESDNKPTQASSSWRFNSLGFAGFICSLVGIVVCLAQPAAFVLSFLALKQKPRGFAISGLVISSAFMISLSTMVILWASIQYESDSAVDLTSIHCAETAMEIYNAASHNSENDVSLLHHTVIESILSSNLDYWDSHLDFSMTESHFTLRSPGPDRVLFTPDDIDVRFPNVRIR